VSPEVLSGERKATKACDLWAVGCILYQMLTGASPFRAETEYLTFEIIMKHCKGSSPLRYPPVIDAPARDLIVRLLRPVDSDRLGAGSDVQLNGYDALRAHSFFSGIEWGRLEYLTAPFIPDASTFPVSDNMRDGSTNDWLLEGEATPIMNKARFSAIGSGRPGAEDGNNGSKRTTSVFNKFLNEREQTEFDSTVYKRVVSESCFHSGSVSVV
jgi:3-phosphoinositide dependent protein kinase-1